MTELQGAVALPSPTTPMLDRRTWRFLDCEAPLARRVRPLVQSRSLGD